MSSIDQAKADVAAMRDISKFNKGLKELGRIPVSLKDIFCKKNKLLNSKILKE